MSGGSASEAGRDQVYAVSSPVSLQSKERNTTRQFIIKSMNCVSEMFEAVFFANSWFFPGAGKMAGNFSRKKIFQRETRPRVCPK